MAKANRGGLFGSDGVIINALEGLATGMGVRGYDRNTRLDREERQANQRRNEQQRAVEAGEKARREAMAAQPIDPATEAAFLGQLLGQPAGAFDPAGQPQVQQDVPAPVDDPLALQDPAGLDFQAPSLFGDMDDMGGYPAPVVDPVVEMDSYLQEIEQAPLSPEGEKGRIRLNQIAEQAQSDELLPHQREELVQQFQKERDRLKLERKIQKPPTVAGEAQTRIAEGPNGMQTILQPDGRIDTKDPTTKAELKQFEIQQKEQESRMTIESMRMQQQEQRRMEREQQRLEQVKVERDKQMKLAEEKQTRWQEYKKTALKEKPMSARHAEELKKYNDAYKAKFGKLPMNPPSRSALDALARATMQLDFNSTDQFLSAPLPTPAMKPEDRIRQMIDEDPEGFRETFNEKKQELLLDPARTADPTREEVFAAMMQDTPESLKAEFENVLAKRNVSTAPFARAQTETMRPSLAAAAAAMSGRGPATEDTGVASPSDALVPSAVQPRTPAPPNPLRDEVAAPVAIGSPNEAEILPATHGNPEDIAAVNEYAKKHKLDPKSITWDEAETIRQDRDAMFAEDAKRDIAMTMIKSAGDLPELKKTAEALKKAGLEQKDVSRLIDLDVVEYYQNQGSASPIEDAAIAIRRAVNAKQLHVSLLDDETKAWVKSRYPVIDPSDPALEELGPGQKYITPWGQIEKTTRKAPPPRDAGDRERFKYTNRDQDRTKLERQTPK